MMAAKIGVHILDELPPISGRVQAGALLATNTWFRVGGSAEVLVRPDDAQALSGFLRGMPLQVPVTVLGAASNVIVRDGGILGIVIRLTRGFGAIEVDSRGIVAGGAALDATVAAHATEAGLAGLEFLSGIPGTIGGAVMMNAGAYGADVANTLDWAEIVTRQGELLRLSAGQIGFAYRHSSLPPECVVVRARFTATRGERNVIAARVSEIRKSREATQPVRARTGGSTFRNPAHAKAWELIDAAGCRGLTHGGAQLSEKHCNFLLNTGNATAADIEGLGEEVRRRVHADSAIALVWEIKRIGVPAHGSEVMV